MRAATAIGLLCLVAGAEAGSLESVPDSPAAPALRLQDPGGRLHDLSEQTGTIVLVNFWASWCLPCLQEMPSLERLRTRLADQGFEVLAVNVGEDPRRAQAMLARLGYTGTLLLDPDQSAFAAWEVQVLPMSFVIGPAGRVRLRAVGDLEWDAEDVVERLRALMDGAPDTE